MKVHKRYYPCVEPSIYSEQSASMEPPVNFEPPSLNIELSNHTEPTMNIKPLPMKLEPSTSEELSKDDSEGEGR